jgi:hypothetical protein
VPFGRDSHELFQWLSGGSYEVECGITGLYVRQPLLSGIYDVLNGTRPCLLEVLRSASTPGHQPLERAPSGFRFHRFLNPAYLFLLLHQFTLCTLDRRDSASASSQDFHFPPVGLLR